MSGSATNVRGPSPQWDFPSGWVGPQEPGPAGWMAPDGMMLAVSDGCSQREWAKAAVT
jgi:hypothetical protein